MYESPYNTVTAVGEGACIIARSAEPFCDLAVIEAEYDRLVELLERERPSRVLVDLRATRGRNDPDFESTLAPYRRRMLSVAPDTTILVESAVGELQVARLVSLDGLAHVRVTRDVDAARARLVGP